MNNKTNYEYLLSDLSSLKGVGTKTKNLLKKKNINNLFDLRFYCTFFQKYLQLASIYYEFF